ncbi:MAG: hypothetical protein WD770_10330 [Actinomycetota bacterium]
MADELPTDPPGVWHLIQRADELTKYAQNRDPRTAYAQAREHLQRAISAADGLEDRGAGENLAEQARVRMDDLDRLEEGLG